MLGRTATVFRRSSRSPGRGVGAPVVAACASSLAARWRRDEEDSQGAIMGVPHPLRCAASISW